MSIYLICKKYIILYIMLSVSIIIIVIIIIFLYNFLNKSNKTQQNSVDITQIPEVTGGGVKDTIGKYKVIKKLGAGVYGTTYLIDKDGEKYALKIQRIDKSEIKENLKSKLWREIEFGKFTNKHPDSFCKLYAYEIDDNCDHVQEEPTVELDKDLLDDWHKTQKSKYCLKLMYEYIKGKPLADIFDSLSQQQVYSLVTQVTYAIMLLKKNGYMHNDLHFGNIMAIKVPKKTTIKLGKKEVKTHGYIFKVIDYGQVINPSFKLSKSEKLIFKNISNDIDVFYSQLYQDPQFEIKKQFNEPDEVEMYNKIIFEPEYDTTISKYLTNFDETNIYLVIYMFKLLNPDRYYEIMGIPKVVKNYKKDITPQKIAISDYFVILSNIDNLQTIFEYFLAKTNV